MGRRGDDLYPPRAFGRAPRGKRLAALGSIGPDELQALLQRLKPDEQASCPCLIGGIGRRDIDRQQQPERVDQEMPFPALVSTA